MPELSIHEKRETLRARILADAVERAVRWLCFVAIVCGLAGPLAYDAWRDAGLVPGLVVLALCVAMAWHVKPHGRSAHAQCKEIEARFKLQD